MLELKFWVDLTKGNLMKCTREKTKVLIVRWNDPMSGQSGDGVVEWQPSAQYLEVAVDARLQISQEGSLFAN